MGGGGEGEGVSEAPCLGERKHGAVVNSDREDTQRSRWGEWERDWDEDILNFRYKLKM